MTTEEFADSLAVIISDAGKSDGTGLIEDDYLSKKTNIDAFLQIERTGLKNGQLEKRLLMYKSLAEESVYIEYPGKESTNAYVQIDNKKMMNPNDFRPELHLVNGDVSAKMSLVDIAESVVEYCREHDERTGQILAAMIIRLAYMKGYRYKELIHPSQLISFEEGGKKTVHSMERKDKIGRYFLAVTKDAKSFLNEFDNINIPSVGYKRKLKVSMEGFLYYLDILAQQEDCKYYYTRKQKGETLKVEIGRINNLLTIANVIDRIQDDRPFGDIIGTMGRYVRPLKASNFEKVTGGIVTITKDTNNIMTI